MTVKKERIQDLKTKMRTVSRLFSYSGKYKAVLILSVLLAAVFSVASHLIPIYLGRAIDLTVAEDNVDFAGVGRVLAVIPVFIALGAASDLILRIVSVRGGAYIIGNLRRAAFSKIQSLPLSYLDSHSRGDTLNRIISDADRLSEGLVGGLVSLYSSVFGIIVTLIMMISISPLVALAVVALTPISMIAAAFISGRTYSMFKKSADLSARQSALIEESVTGGVEIKLFGNEEVISERFEKINEDYRKTASRAVFYSSITNPVTRFVNSIVYCGVALAGGFITLSGAVAVGDFVALLTFARDYAKPFNDISGVIAEAQNSLASAMRIFELIDEPDEPADPSDACVFTDEERHGAVQADDVSFSYTDKPFMSDINFLAEPGERIAIVGPTGCGKTTLVNLLMRFYPLDEGRITIDGKDISGATKRSLRSSFGMVLQDTWLSSGTVRENITVGKPDATDEEIVRAAVDSHADPFIRRLPQGYDTPLGDAGGALSAGEKQLLCIARVMLALPPILILDEATSSIDTRTEIRIQEAFAEMMKGRTSFIVAHRLNTIKNADRILVMKDGKLIEQGSHEELMRAEGFYASLYGAQFS